MRLFEITDINKTFAVLRGKDYNRIVVEYENDYRRIIEIWNRVKQKDTKYRSNIISAAGELQDSIVDMYNESFPDETDPDIISMKEKLKSIYDELDLIVLT